MEAPARPVREAVAHARAAGADELVKARLCVPTLSAALLAARIARERSCDLRVELLFEAETETLTFRVPYVLQKKDLRLDDA